MVISDATAIEFLSNRSPRLMVISDATAIEFLSNSHATNCDSLVSGGQEWGAYLLFLTEFPDDTYCPHSVVP